MKSTASAVWKGDLKGGEGHINTKSNALKDASYTFKTRFEGADGTNPEELIAAAHASCYSMALSNILATSDMTPASVATEATVTLEMLEGGPTVTKVHLDVKASVPGATEEAFMDAANKAKDGCPISRLLNADISMDASLQN